MVPVLIASLGTKSDMMPTMTAGYSKRSLVEKLGIKPGMKLAFFNPPDSYFELLGDLPEEISFAQEVDDQVDFIHFFTTESAELETQFPYLKTALSPMGMLWISWPKGSAKLPTDLNENVIREIGLENGLVDVKVIAVDEVWSGLKFVYRLKDR